MPSTETPTWWADVQQEREDLKGRGRRPAEDWLGEDIDFVPRRRVAASAARGTDAPAVARAAAAADADADDAGADHPLHGVFIAAPARPPARTIRLETGAGGTARTIELHTDDFPAVAQSATSRTIEVEVGGHSATSAAGERGMAEELRHLHAADDPFSTPPAPAGGRRTVQITGRPGEGRASQAQRHRPRTTSDRVGHRPDRVALWAVLLGAILILLAATSSSDAATPRPVAPAPSAAVTQTVATPAAPAFVAPVRGS